jgi:hypothetical protein
MDLKIMWEFVDWIYLVQDRVQRRALVSTVMNLRASYKVENILTSWASVRFSWTRPRVHG